MYSTSSSSTCHDGRVAPDWLPREQSLVEGRLLSRIFHLLQHCIRPALDHSQFETTEYLTFCSNSFCVKHALRLGISQCPGSGREQLIWSVWYGLPSHFCRGILYAACLRAACNPPLFNTLQSYGLFDATDTIPSHHVILQFVLSTETRSEQLDH